MWPVGLEEVGAGYIETHGNITEMGIIKLSAVNNSINKRRENQIIVCR
jgi:hypothetical protein